MTIEFKKNQIVFHEVVGVEDAEALLEWLQKKRTAKADLSACTHLHAANLQVLMAAKPAIQAWPADAPLRAWLEPILAAP
ncbi:hypothetical protein G3480_17750 [Thiorhodococcus mannitoliphagus]|uniref:Uncharacterized protein n=1 Tax=Thiorhodococcus mannitoliphagus TaxID=329406 RepID=A0A6P1DUV9_9GAMM|nr:hypothetical protein [Thiorhodococcus mannitoliphagus]NEX22127.1 hypothetical protein [Thiorhodococcus mannitoliphagus]